jgi:hypothetical protein
VILLLAGCVQPGASSRTDSGATKIMQTAKVEALGDGTSRITVPRSLDGESAEGQVIVPSSTASTSGGAPHAVLAEARAFLALGEKLLARDRLEPAIQAAKSGLSALGDDYAPAGVADDTGLKILAAEDQIAQGHLRNAASMMLRMLEIRVDLYAERHRPAVVR